jgi:spore germination protein YaaH
VVGRHTSREVFGFALASSLADPTVGYPSWNFDLLTTVAFFGVHVGSGGHLAGDSGWDVWNSSALTNLVSIAHQHGVKVVLTVILQDFSPNTPHMCDGLASAGNTVIETAAQVRAKGVDGVNLDYEGLDGSCGSTDPYWAQHTMTALAASMRVALGSTAYLSVDTYSGAAADGYGFFDVAGLANYVDSMFVMAYDMEYSNYYSAPLFCSSFCLGPTSPLTAYRYNASTVMAQYVAAVPASKVILGVPYYGRKACVANASSANQYPTSSVVADSYLDASTEAVYFEVKPGTYAIHREANSAGMERWDTWYNTTLNCIRELYWDDAVSLGKKYDLVNADGLRGVGIWNLNYGGGAPELWAALQNHFIVCGGAAMSVSPTSPQLPGAQVAFTATSSGCPNPLYQFWMLAPGGTWTVAQAYTTAATFNWNTTGRAAGTYSFSVWVRDASSPGATSNSLGRFDAFVPGGAYVLNPACTAAYISAAPPSPSTAGPMVTITASAATCPNPRYQFWVLAPGGSWTIAQAYSGASSFSWNTAGKAAGTYRLSVWARDAGSTGANRNSLGTFDAYVPGTAYTLNSTPCTSVTASVAPASPQAAGTAVTFTGSASSCPNPRYQFWVLAPGGTWTVAQAYSTTATFTWNTSGRAPGVYHVSVWALDASRAGSYDSYFPGAAYALDVPCTTATGSAAPASPQPHGTTITFTGGASACANPRYQFWLLAPGAKTWTLGQAYSASATFNWNSTSNPAGTYRYSVWVRDATSTSSYDSYFPGAAFTLT